MNVDGVEYFLFNGIVILFLCCNLSKTDDLHLSPCNIMYNICICFG